MNGDGHDDIVIGGYYTGSALQARIYLGTDGSMSDVLATPAASILAGAPVETAYGLSIAKAGDVNGDGYDDIVVGSYQDNIVYVYFGNPGGTIDPNADGILKSTSNGLYGWSVAYTDKRQTIDFLSEEDDELTRHILKEKLASLNVLQIVGGVPGLATE